MPRSSSPTIRQRVELLVDQDTQVALGVRLGRCLDYRGCVYLIGELGAGKTTLARGVLRGLGHRGAVKSPTYTLLEPYLIGQARVNHFDLYRLGDPEELEFIGARELFEGDALNLIEWPSRGEGWLPPADLVVELKVLDTGREATLTAISDHGAAALGRLERSSSEAE